MSRLEHGLIWQDLTKNDNGKTVRVGPLKSFQSITATWMTPQVAAAGRLTVTVDGDPGSPAGANVIELGATGQPGSRTLTADMRLAVVDIAVTGIPEGGFVRLYFR